jgi:carbon-monoxide dehydrogenase medium subunit
MKPSAFRYHRPTDLGEALGVLAEVGADGKVLAGGQSLVPLMNMRLAAPAHLIDVNRLSELSYVDTRSDGVRVGALARHALLLSDAASALAVPLLREATGWVAHPAIRNRGTTVGSLVHADPAAEMPAVLALLSGSVRLASARGERSVPAADFFLGPLTSAVRPDELAVEAVFPTPAPRSGTAWVEFSRRRGDYALCGVGALVTVDGDGSIVDARAAYAAMGPTPVVLDLTGAVAGQPKDAADWPAAGALAAARLSPDGDIHASAAYRRHLAGVLTARALASAVAHV